MADKTGIEWTDATWNPIVGCSVVSPGCTNCYAMRLAGTRMKHHPSRAGLTRDSKAGPVWTGEVRFMEPWLTQPLHWSKPRMIFVCAHADLFHEAVPDEWIDRVFAVMALCPQHTFQVLTKRPERMRKYVSENLGGRIQDVVDNMEPDGIWKFPGYEPWITDDFPLPNVWLGVSIEDQRRADERIGILGATPAALRWVSAEPLLGRIDFDIDQLRVIDWVVAGGESGPGARPMHPDWARSLRDQCAAAGAPFLFKQWGEWVSVLDRDRDDPDWRADYPKHERIGNRVLNLAGGSGFHGERVHIMHRIGKKAAGRLLDGVIHDGYPEVRPHA
ncbi:hypothetical protein ABB55_27645 [Prosthecomicrobium hirschii]|uniref:Phage Gp37/Gp68 family protein n=1 Tax=Prosthecodimorpha hirschii TaxID=665126 RepID=A0A0P6VWK2_9HYPH|nr:phage Gp37/Gp68 family protein [Prosthecomicrobium hirschii]KPL55542.1 hypothetical protein ABB55_27645 [Prosthecomicrobium hirschii]